MPKMTKSGCLTETAKMTYHTKLMFGLEFGRILAFFTMLMHITACFMAKLHFPCIYVIGAIVLNLVACRYREVHRKS